MTAKMSTNKVRTNAATGNAGVARVAMKLEAIVIPVSDVDRSKEFYAKLGWRLIGAGFVDTPLSASLRGDELENRRNQLRATLPTAASSSRPTAPRWLYTS
jgi:catechol 2,3-dioxygenase-like lactoylglutathione lyase family enzyme